MLINPFRVFPTFQESLHLKLVWEMFCGGKKGQGTWERGKLLAT